VKLKPPFLNAGKSEYTVWFVGRPRRGCDGPCSSQSVVLAGDAHNARYVAEAIAREAFHNVAYFPGTLDEARAAVVR
jgi:hypothetical protein